MTDNSTSLKPASPVRKTAARAARAGVNVVWLVPILALVVTLGVAWNSFAERGKVIEVEFADATGISPGETALRFREITVGQVEAVRFTSDLSRVVVEIRVDKDVAKYIDSDAQFWIVRPQVSAQGVTRLDTVLTGSFIEGYWDAEVKDDATQFAGLERPPLIREDAKGSWVRLTMQEAEGISPGAPVMFHGVQVGRLENLRLSDEDDGVVVDAFIEAPHDQRLTTATVFWDTSGFSVSLGARGVSLNVNSLSSLLQGGVSFDTFVSGGDPIQRGQTFVLQPDEDTARANVFVNDRQGQLRLSMTLDGAVQGLEKGAEVLFKGVRVGNVSSLKSAIDPDGDGAEVRQTVTLDISPLKLGLDLDASPDEALDFLQDQVEAGLRARVTSSGLFGTTLMVELVDIPDAEPARIDTEATPLPRIPSVDAELSDFSQTAEGLLTRVGNLPIEEVLKSATDMMDSVTALATSQDTRAIPQDLRAAIEDAQVTLSDIRGMVGEFRDSGAADNAGEALGTAREVADKLNAALENLPAIMQSIQKASTSVEDVDFASIGAQIDATLQDVRDIVGTPEAEALPEKVATLVETLNSTAAQIDTLASEIQASGAGQNLGRMVDEATSAFRSVQDAAADVPEMVDQIDAAAAEVEQFDFAAISTQVEGILADLRAMLGSEDAEQLPRNLSNTLEAASGLLNDLRDGNAAGSLNNALDSASVAADEVAKSVQQLPALIQRLQATAARADAVMAAYGDRSAFNNETINMLRELRRATESFGSLARMIERNPRAFILGR